MRYGIRLKAYTKENLIKKPLYNNKYVRANMMHTEFKYKKVLEDNKHCKYIPIEPKGGDSYTYLSTILDSILFDPNNKHYLQIF